MQDIFFPRVSALPLIVHKLRPVLFALFEEENCILAV